jgi:alpha-L-rhamnosidase
LSASAPWNKLVSLKAPLTSPARFVAAVFALCIFLIVGPGARAAATHLVEQAPLQVTNVGPGIWLVDFGRVAWGDLLLVAPAAATNSITVSFGEDLKNGRINRKPPGSVRFAQAQLSLNGTNPVIAAPPADKRNTTLPAVLTPAEWGVVLPFRWVEIEGWPGELGAEQLVRCAAFATNWDDNAATFRSSDEMLNRIWELCHYSIKATTFAGVYVDGDRERISYEADAYLNQLSDYACDSNPQMARDTFDRLLKYPTWPTEWVPHMVFIAHADWMQNGDATWLAAHYEALKTKLLLDRAGPDGLITSSPAQIKRGDLVDWPTGERDGYVFTNINTVVNAFHLRALTLMADLARAVGNTKDADDFAAREKAEQAVFQRKFFDPAHKLYRDGEGTDHTSLHANLFPLAFGLVPAENREHITAWLDERGMACSVYAAQYLLEALFENDADTNALRLITAPNDRSWRHMVESGATITWEAWDEKYKPNLDWTHAWGAAPANLLSRFVLGAQPLSPGWTRLVIRPHPGELTSAEGKIPTPRGPLTVQWTRGENFSLTFKPPPRTACHLELPASPTSQGVFLGARKIRAHRQGAWWIMDEDIAGAATVEVK